MNREKVYIVLVRLELSCPTLFASIFYQRFKLVTNPRFLCNECPFIVGLAQSKYQNDHTNIKKVFYVDSGRPLSSGRESTLAKATLNMTLVKQPTLYNPPPKI